MLTALLVGAASASVAVAAPKAEARPEADSGGGSGATIHKTVSPAQLFAMAERLARAGRSHDAEVVLQALAANRDPEVRAEARFRLGNLLFGQGELEAAAASYRALLDEKPDATPVRLQLARALALLGREDSARRQLERASSAGLPEDVAPLVDRFSLALRSRRRLGGSFRFGLAPDSNINRASSNSTVEVGDVPLDLSEEARAQSGVGVTLGGEAFVRLPLSPRTDLLATGGASADLYDKNQYNDVSLTFTAGPELLRGASRIRPQLLVGQRWFGGEAYSTSYGGWLNWRRQLNRQSQAELDLIVLHYDYHLNDALDGRYASGAIDYETAFSPRLFGRFGLRIDRQEAQDPAFATWTVGGEVLLSRDVGRQSVFGQASYHHITADAAYRLPPARRDDDLIDVSAGLLFRSLQVRGFAPALKVRWTRSRSPVFFYDYSRVRPEITLTRDF